MISHACQAYQMMFCQPCLIQQHSSIIFHTIKKWNISSSACIAITQEIVTFIFEQCYQVYQAILPTTICIKY